MGLMEDTNRKCTINRINVKIKLIGPIYGRRTPVPAGQRRSFRARRALFVRFGGGAVAMAAIGKRQRRRKNTEA
jgi:hypothetical protein